MSGDGYVQGAGYVVCVGFGYVLVMGMSKGVGMSRGNSRASRGWVDTHHPGHGTSGIGTTPPLNVTGSNFEITFVSEKHMVEDDVLFTNHLAGK